MASRSGNDNDLKGWVRDSKTVRIMIATIHWIPTTARPRAQFKIHDLWNLHNSSVRQRSLKEGENVK